MRIISPSLLAADFSNISNTIKKIEDTGIDRLHLDVMDGYFVPALTFGPMIIKEIRKCSQCHLETHLMIQQPHKTIDQYINVGSDTIMIHLEASLNPEEELSYIRANNVCAGVAINPETEEKRLLPLLKHIDYILIMSVSPGRGGQTFMPETLRKMENVVKMRGDRDILIGVDGGVNMNTIPQVYETGIDITIVGSGLFEAENIPQRYQDLLSA